jgi:hypothetical protein
MGKKKNGKSSPSEVSWELPQRGEGNLILDSWVKQGTDWASWSNTTLSTYARLRLKTDAEEQD